MLGQTYSSDLVLACSFTLLLLHQNIVTMLATHLSWFVIKINDTSAISGNYTHIACHQPACKFQRLLMNQVCLDL